MRPLYDFLCDFQAPPASAGPAADQPCRDELEELRSVAYEEGLSAGRSEGEVALAQAQALAEDELAAARGRWVEEEGCRLTEALACAIADVERSLARDVAAVLEDFISESVKAKAVDAFCSVLREHLADRRRPSIRLTGPDDLVQAVQARLQHTAVAIEFEASDSVELMAVDDGATFRTRIEAWREILTATDEDHV